MVVFRAAQKQIEVLYGTADLPQSAGVLHVAAVAQTEGEADRFLKIGPDSPKSAADTFALSLSRARADAILTTAKILRDEPRMRVEPFGAHAASLIAWRAAAKGGDQPPVLLILSRSGDIPLSHPALTAWVRPIVVTGAEGAAAVRAQLGVGAALGIHVMAVPGPDEAVTWAQESLGAETISVEAGPSTANGLYEHACRVDELMLSVFEGPVPDAVLGAPFVSRARLHGIFGAPVSQTERPGEAHGRWRLQRWRRRPA